MNWSLLMIMALIILNSKTAQSPQYINLWVAWNVGQGQWVTHILPDHCLHYDVGGEFNSFTPVRKSLLSWCGAKMNLINISHWDYDHILNIPQLTRNLPRLCFLNKPEYGSSKKASQKILQFNIPTCQISSITISKWTPMKAKDTNSSSIIFMDDAVLTTGDSPIQQENIWTNELLKVKTTRVLILGHHGSRTSTGTLLLKRLPHLKFSIASARFAKYGHPHQEPLKRLSSFHIPVIKTEDWGNIWFMN